MVLRFRTAKEMNDEIITASVRLLPLAGGLVVNGPLKAREPIAQVGPLSNKGVDFAVQDASLRPSIGELMRRQPLNTETRLEFAVLPVKGA